MITNSWLVFGLLVFMFINGWIFGIIFERSRQLKIAIHNLKLVEDEIRRRGKK